MVVFSNHSNFLKAQWTTSWISTLPLKFWAESCEIVAGSPVRLGSGSQKAAGRQWVVHVSVLLSVEEGEGRAPHTLPWGSSLCLYLGSPMTNKQNHTAQLNVVSSWLYIWQVWERWISLIALFLILSTARNVCAPRKYTIQIREQWEAAKWFTLKTKHTFEIATASSWGSYMSTLLGFILPLSLIFIDSLSIPFWAG